MSIVITRPRRHKNLGTPLHFCVLKGRWWDTIVLRAHDTIVLKAHAPTKEKVMLRRIVCIFTWKWLFFFGSTAPQWAMASSFLRFLDHTQRRITVGRTPLDEWSARRRDLYLTSQNPLNRQTSMTPVGFEPTISAGERPQTYALDRAATGHENSTVINTRNEYRLNWPSYNISYCKKKHLLSWRQ